MGSDGGRAAALRAALLRNPLESDEVNARRKQLDFPKTDNVYTERQETWPKLDGPGFKMFKRKQHSTGGDGESVEAAPYLDPLKMHPKKADELARRRRKIDAYCIRKRGLKIPPLAGRTILFPDARTMSYDQVRKSDIHFWRSLSSKARQTSLQIRKPHLDKDTPMINLEHEDSYSLPSMEASDPSDMPVDDASVNYESDMIDFDADIDLESSPDVVTINEEQGFMNFEKRLESAGVGRILNSAYGASDDQWTSYPSIRTRLARLLTRRGLWFPKVYFDPL